MGLLLLPLRLIFVLALLLLLLLPLPLLLLPPIRCAGLTTSVLGLVIVIVVVMAAEAVCGGTVGLVMLVRKPVTVIPEDDSFNMGQRGGDNVTDAGTLCWFCTILVFN